MGSIIVQYSFLHVNIRPGEVNTESYWPGKEKHLVVLNPTDAILQESAEPGLHSHGFSARGLPRSYVVFIYLGLPCTCFAIMSQYISSLIALNTYHKARP